MKNDSIIQMWKDYKKINPEAPTNYDAWAFGDSKEMADDLAALVLEGTKTATASNYILYELENEELPYVGLMNVILDGEGNAVAIVETTSVEIVPFDEVTAEQAYLEGEGDRTLSYWREVHEAFFKKELEAINQDFNYNILVVCERFQMVYKK
ncbi:ASCH domain-containing protein [Paraliobacillus sp. JSM ZJ581]|uniref:ASCH domain-containing protein n=1 Tax=Paraliobacillus sp. JSM ZJ581 TaxID=3342118 RepID=UPI0035A876E3